jgi:hypothetical protein
MFLAQELLLPEMQRKYVWKGTQVRDLIDSIYRDYPSGSILVWESNELPQVKEPNVAASPVLPLGKRLLLLDGQQRITSLASVLTGQPVRIREGRQIRERFVDILFNIDHPDTRRAVGGAFEVGDAVEARWGNGEFHPGQIVISEKGRYFIAYADGDEGWTDDVKELDDPAAKELFFQIRNKKIENRLNWISVTDLFKNGVGSILRALKVGADNPKFDAYNARLNQLYGSKDSYLYPIQIIRDKNYREVTEIFIRVNSSGTRLRSSDLALAQITSAWPGSMRLFETFSDECIKRNFHLDEAFLVRCLVAIATGQARFDKTGRLTVEALKEAWKAAQKGVEKAINFLKNQASVDSSAGLPSPSLLIPLVYFAHRDDLAKSEDTERACLRWLYCAAIWGRYSKSSESNLDQDLTGLRGRDPWRALLSNVWKTVGQDREVAPTDIRGKGVNSPLFFMMYVIARRAKARDLETGDVINYENFGKNNEIQYDHLFPKSKLDKFLKTQMEEPERKKIINELANMAFMTKKGNLIKRADDPERYFPKVLKKRGPEVFSKQCIPYDEATLKYERYEAFLDARVALLAAEINRTIRELV